ncbi:MAG: tRNA pseudouridine(55) synthase TruB [Gammaproteobacteria bacterium]|nr:MAG: tRNA pseudouridine(55) synthase TruB [Gammaproteobacteria bacterium]
MTSRVEDCHAAHLQQRRSERRNIHGLVLLDKPVGMTSNRALQRVKRLYSAKKAGHTGSLDPLASGLLPVCLGEATKISSYLLDADKTYETTVQLGWSTTTGDEEGDVLRSKRVPALTEERVQQALAGFEGDYDQVPPMYSAIKKSGQPLYRLARKGVEVEREKRRVRIVQCHLLHLDDNSLRLRLRCSKGTYVRVFAEDLAEALGTCGHVKALRRIAVGRFSEADMVSLAQLQNWQESGQFERLSERLVRADQALSDWPEIDLPDPLAKKIRQGNSVSCSMGQRPGLVRLYAGHQRFLGIGQVDAEGKVSPKRLFNE